MIDALFTAYSVRKLRQLHGRIEDCAGRLTDEQIWMRHSEAENSVGNLLLHLAGNVRQWIVSGVGGQPDVRRRNEEFEAEGGVSRKELMERLAATVHEAARVMESLTAERLAESVRIQNYDVTVLEAVYHVVEHFSMHTGQIIFATKMLTGADLGFYAHLRTTAAHGQKTP